VINLVNIQIIDITENKILHRKEVTFNIEHLKQGSPNRIEVRDKLAAMQTASSGMTFIKTMQPVFGLPQVHGTATIYDNEDVAKKLEPDYSKIRNLPKEKRDEALKNKKAKKQKKKK